MSSVVRCVCGRQLRARADFAGTRAECPTCGHTVEIPHPSAAASQPQATAAPSPAADPFAEALEIPEGTVKSRLAYGLTALRREMSAASADVE